MTGALARSGVRVLGHLDPGQVSGVLRLVDAATEADGTSPLDEHVLLHLRHGGDAASRNLLVEEDGRLVAYAHLDTTDPVDGASAQLVVDPAERGRGVGRSLVRELVALSPDGRLRLWAHGERSDVPRMIAPLGFARVRTLRQLRRSLVEPPLPEPVLPTGVRVRAYRPGVDDEAWVALNALAFATHPEQGAMTVEDLRRRVAEPWFDASGFFLAERADAAGLERLVGFHWTKVHGAKEHGHEPIGEVYVLGIAPSEQGSGLGRALSLVGLQHLRDLGLDQAMLYVEADNAAAVRLYTSLGFTGYDTDVMYARS